MSEEKTILEKIQLDPGMSWLEVTEGFRRQWNGRVLWPSDIQELNEIIAKQNDWLCIEAQRLQTIEKFKNDLGIAIEALEYYSDAQNYCGSLRYADDIETFPAKAIEALKKIKDLK